MKFNLRKWKQCFIKFVQWYNANLPAFSNEGKHAIRELHQYWKDASMNISIESFWKIKEHHELISTDMYNLNILNQPEWMNYIEYGQKFRMEITMMTMSGHMKAMQ